VLIFDVQRQKPLVTVDEQTQQTESKERADMRLAYVKDEKSPVSAIAQLEGFLMLAIGPKIIVYQFFDGQRLIGTAFFDAQLFIASLNTVKNWVVVGDIYKSVYFLRWKEEGKSLTLLAKDFQHLHVYTTEYIIESSNLGIIVTDSSKNMLLYSYSPQSAESRSGQMLLCRADFHVGSHIHKLIRLPVLGGVASSNGNTTPRHALVFGTLDGGVGYIRPLEELIFKKLAALQSKLLTAIPHVGGLNPRAFRLAKPGRRAQRIHQKHMLDGELVFKFLTLDRPKQREIALAIGADPDALIANIRDIDSSVAYF